MEALTFRISLSASIFRLNRVCILLKASSLSPMKPFGPWLHGQRPPFWGFVVLWSVVAWSHISTFGADVVSTFKGGSGLWGVAINWTNTPFLGGFPNNGNAGVATYDAILPGGTVTLDTNIVIQKLTQSGGTITGTNNLTANDLHTWKGGTLSGSGTNFDNGGLLVNGTVS